MSRRSNIISNEIIQICKVMFEIISYHTSWSCYLLSKTRSQIFPNRNENRHLASRNEKRHLASRNEIAETRLVEIYL